MTRFPFIAIAAAAVLAVGCKESKVQERILALPPVIQGYKVDPYIEVAAELQTLDREAACSALLGAATNASGFQDFSVFVLCRMLFTNNPAGYFRGPRIGAFTFVGSTTDADWPLAPIEMVDGIPFLIATRYQLSGQAEPVDAYVRDCISDCAWSSMKFTPRTRAQKNAALAKLLASKKWPTPLSQWDRDYLAAQLK